MMPPAAPVRMNARLEHSRRELEQFKYALDQSAIVAITDQRGVITYVNEKFCEISQYGRDELIGRDHRIVNSGYHPKEFIRNLWRSIARGRVWRGEIRNRAKDGSIYWVDTTIVPLLDWRNKPRQYLSIRYDITERKLIGAQLRDNAALTKLGELAAIVAHEVRNPLAGLKGSLQILGSRLPAHMKEREIVSTMIERINALSERVNDILLYAGTTPPHLQPVSVQALLAEVVGLAGAACAKGGGISFSRTDVTVLGDFNMLREVLLNLILNACQAADPGEGVHVTIDAQPPLCRLTILDRGAGIPADVRTRVFEPFFTTKRGGTGLGLAIVKSLLDRQGGSVSLEDRPGGGTAATVSLPLYAA